MNEKRLSWRGKLALAVLSPIVVFGLLEVGLRIAGFRYEPWNDYLWGRSCEELKQKDLYRPDPELLWTLQPNQVLTLPYFGFFQVHTNSLGLRGPEIPKTKEPGEFRVLCLGESVSFGIGLRDGQTWPAQMQDALRDSPEMKGRLVRVINGAVPGWSSVQGMRLLDRLSWVRPDVIVFWFGFADAHDMRGVPDSAERFPSGGVPLTLRPLWKLRSFQLVQKWVTAARAATYEGTRVSEAEFKANVHHLEDLAASGGPRTIFVHEPERVNATIRQLDQVMRRADETGAKYLIAPNWLLSWIVPAPDGVDLVGTPCRFHDEPALMFAPQPGRRGYDKSDVAKKTEDLRSDLDMLKRLKRNFDRLLSNLPPRSLRYRDLFGAHRPEEVFADNCHLTPLGAHLAGGRIAAEAIRRMK